MQLNKQRKEKHKMIHSTFRQFLSPLFLIPFVSCLPLTATTISQTEVFVEFIGTWAEYVVDGPNGSYVSGSVLRGPGGSMFSGSASAEAMGSWMDPLRATVAMGYSMGGFDAVGSYVGPTRGWADVSITETFVIPGPAGGRGTLEGYMRIDGKDSFAGWGSGDGSSSYARFSHAATLMGNSCTVLDEQISIRQVFSLSTDLECKGSLEFEYNTPFSASMRLVLTQYIGGNLGGVLVKQGAAMAANSGYGNSARFQNFVVRDETGAIVTGARVFDLEGNEYPVETAAVPEPSALYLCGPAMLGLFLLKRG
jgi:hypothetical protein